MDILKEGKQVFETEIETLNKIKNELNGDFLKAIDMLHNCKGRIIVTGMGKSGHIGNKIAATMASLGIPTYFLHPAEGLHGDLGRVTSEDVVLALSNSGETDEILGLIPTIKTLGAKLISMTGKKNSTLEENADVAIVLPIMSEASAYKLAPTTSTTAALVYGDALAVVLSKMIDFKPEDFALFHPSGALGKRLLLKVDNIMHKEEENAKVQVTANLKSAILEMSSKGLGMVNIVDNEDNLLGIITDGDIRRIIEKEMDNMFAVSVKDVMTKNPISIMEGTLAFDALKIMENRERQLMVLPVVDKDKKLVGSIRIHDIIKAGI